MKKLIKKALEKIIYTFYAKKYDNLCELVENYDYISFDIFDTLIKRNVKNSTDIFDVVEYEYNKLHTNISNFKENRMKAEILARKKSSYEDVTLEEIYEELKDYTKEEKKQLKKLEIQSEKDLCVLNKPMYDFYKYCLSNNKKIFFTSDMYLEKQLVEEILNKLGYKHYEKIYLSSNDKLRKRTGNLFRKLLKEENIEKDKIIHIGDSITGDFLIPRKIGINTILIKREINNSTFFSKSNKSIEYNMLSSFVNNNVYDMSPYEHLGYEILGPMLYGFTSWIHEQVKKEKIDKLYFLARDAKIIMEVYKRRYKEEIPIHYLKVSRISILNATVSDMSSFDDLLYKYKSIIKDTSKVKDLINILNIKTKVSYENKLIMDLSNEEKKEIFSFIKEDVLKENEYQNKCFKEYLKQEDLNGKVGLIDIGWNGTIQYILNNIVDSKTKLYGYYFGVMQDKKYKEYDINRNGYLFGLSTQNDNQSVVALNIGLFEIMFLSTEGSTLKYKENGKNVEVICGKVEHSKDNIEIINQIQSSALEFVNNLENSDLKKYSYYFDKEIFFEAFKNMTINPTEKNINLIKDIEFLNFSKNNLINNKSLIYYLFHLKEFYSDFMNSYCKIFFMKNVFKIKIPYYKILKKAYCKKKMW